MPRPINTNFQDCLVLMWSAGIEYPIKGRIIGAIKDLEVTWIVMELENGDIDFTPAEAVSKILIKDETIGDDKKGTLVPIKKLQ